MLAHSIPAVFLQVTRLTLGVSNHEDSVEVLACGQNLKGMIEGFIGGEIAPDGSKGWPQQCLWRPRQVRNRGQETYYRGGIGQRSCGSTFLPLEAG